MLLFRLSAFSDLTHRTTCSTGDSLPAFGWDMAERRWAVRFLAHCMQVAPAASNKKGKLLIPPEEVNRVMTEVAVQPGPTGLLKLAGIKNIVEGWCGPACPCSCGLALR